MKKSIIIIATFLAIAHAQDIGWYKADSKQYSISTADELKGLQAIVENGIENFNGKTILLKNDIALEGNWIPIGNGTRSFQGIFDGKGFTISGLFVNDAYYAGLFGYVGKNGQIKNVNVIATIIKWTNRAGGLAGAYISSKPIENSSVKADSIFGEISSGLVGYADTLTISNSYAIGYVSGSGKIGGLVGEVGTVTISNSYASGNSRNVMKSAFSTGYSTGYSGGLVGEAKTVTISNSYASGNVYSSGYRIYSGGLVGGARTVTISNSYASGDVSSSISDGISGGLVGGLANGVNGSISNSYASGDISGDISGGLVGNANTFTISNSYASGDVSGKTSGGLVGNAYKLTISSSYAGGNVSGKTSGGLVGKVKDINILNGYASGNISANTCGGLVGEAETSNISNSYANVKISGETFGGILGNYGGGPINSSVYFNSDKATKAAGKGSPLGISGISGDNLKNQASFKDWDFKKIWNIDSEIIGGYPYLRWNEKTVQEVYIAAIQKIEKAEQAAAEEAEKKRLAELQKKEEEERKLAEAEEKKRLEEEKKAAAAEEKRIQAELRQKEQEERRAAAEEKRKKQAELIQKETEEIKARQRKRK